MSKNSFSLQEIAHFVDGKVIGDSLFRVVDFNSLQKAKPNEIVFLHSNKYLEQLESSQSQAVLIDKNIDLPNTKQKHFIVVENSRYAFVLIQNKFEKPKQHSGKVSPQAIVDASASIGENVTIYPFVYVGKNAKIKKNTVIYSHSFIGDGVQIGANCFIYPHCSILDRVKIGNSAIIHSGTIIGGDGFGFETHKNQHHKISHRGIVEIGDDVEIGANCTIDRGTLENTIIGNGSKIDNLVHIAHNVRIGENCLLAGQVGIAGSTHLGNQVYCGGQVGILGHNKIGNNSIFHPSSVFMQEKKQLPEGSYMAGNPAIPITEWRRNIVVQKKLASLEKKLKELEKKQTS